nr:uncharacterized protein LOC123745535 [Procambarus clarkii]
MAAMPAWRSSSILQASLPLMLLLAVASHGGKSKTFLRNNYSPQDQPQTRTNLQQPSFARFGRNFRVDDEPSQFPNFGGFPAASSTGSFRSPQSLKSRKGGSRTFGGPRGFPGFGGGPDSFLEAATTERSETDEEIQAFQFSGSAGFESTRPGSPGSRKGGAGRGATKVGGAKSPSGSSSFGFPEASPGLGGRDSPPFPTFSGSAGLDFPGLTGQEFNAAGDLIFGRSPQGLGLSAPGAPTFGGSAVPDFNFGANNAFFSGAEVPPQVRPGTGSTANTFTNFMSSFQGSGTNPFASSPIQFPSSRGQFPGPASSIFPQPGEETSVQFPPSPNFVIPETSASFPYPIDEHIANLLLREIETTTTKPPNRVISEEDRKKVFSGGLEFTDEAEFARLTVPKGGVKKSPETKKGCNSKPSAPANGRTDCSTYAGCRAVCNPRYQFPTGERRLFLTCNDGEWEVTGGSWGTLPNCEPICIPPCENSGICLAPDVCQCPDNWEGSSCEIPKAPPRKECSTKPPTPTNSRIFCSKNECIARCHEGYHFSEGTSRLTFECDNGVWVVRQSSWSGTTPDCQPICDPACTNEGRCIAPNVCECTPEYRGDICQYPISNCDPKNLGFNGGYNCSGEGMDFGCVLWCPADVEFDFPAAEFYTCDYSSGVWSPSPIPMCDYGFLAVTPSPFEPSRGTYPPLFGVDASLITTTQKVKKLPGSCFTWSGTHFKSFDGKVYSFESSCPYTLLQDSSHGTFTVNLRTADGCQGSSCPKVIQIFLEDDEYVLQATETGEPSLAYRDTNLAIPGQMNGVVSERVAHFVVVKVSGLGLTIKWDMKSLVVTEISELLWNRTSGLCGRRDGSQDNDWSYADGTLEPNVNSFLQAWQAKTLGERCLDRPKTKHPCGRKSVGSEADRFCARLRDDPRFEECRQVVDVEPFVSTCRWDYCDCHSQDRETCSCETFAAFFRECISVGINIPDGWRSQDLCPMVCESGKGYNPCMSAIQPRCGQAADSVRPDFCVEGCDCPANLVLHQNLCIPAQDCPCTYRDKVYSTGDTIPNDCNSCTCLGGNWVCTEVKCGSRCAVVGDPHYTTFDGRHFDFMGKCSYYLVQGQDFSIEAENTPCAGAISESMNFPGSVVSQFPSCTKSVTVRVEGTVIRLKQDREVTINGVELKELPAWVKGAYIKAASSLFLMVELGNGLDVWWDGQTRVYIDAPAEFRGMTAGLCGTFTDNQRDDFLTPEGDVEQNVIAFSNKWKTSEKCPDQPLADETRPCDRHVQNKAVAEKFCAKLKSNLFGACHLEVDPDPYYRDCLYDMCSCETKMDGCLCPVLAAYSKECARKGVLVDWRAEVRQCGIHCTGGQKYQVCGNSCSHTCLDLATNSDCTRKCVEGCNCLDGFSLDGTGMCVPVTECPCVYEAKEYKPGYEMMQQQPDASFLVCECYNAGWNCWKPRENETVTRPPQVDCHQDKHEVYTDCLPDEENTCQTMHLRPVTSDLCRPGCVCASGYVRDADTGACIRHNECPCHHGGRSYDEKATITEDCNTCTCEGGQWACTEHQCPGICTAWGDSHYKTFDGRLYEFYGTCDYLLAKGKASTADHFEVIIQNVPCGTDGVTCAKSITLRVGSGDALEAVEFSRNKPTPTRNMTRTIIREAGLFVFAEVTDMGLVLQWDRGTRAYLRLDPVWKGKVRGLCGNYNGDEQDDFQTPSGGSSEVSVKIFGDSWRLQNYCPDSILIKDTCSLHPHRKVWAADQCAVLKTPIFAACHSEVPVEPYEERCQFDACGCDTGGDCECLCTAIAAYAHECNIHGVYIKWRTPKLCPMQCDESCEHYEPCIPTCTQVNCDTLLDPSSPICTQDACVEGCAKDICPPGQVYKSSTDLECVPKADCEKKCMEIDGKVYMEGDTISQDDCHTCSCSRKQKICRGTPCVSSTTTTMSTSTTPARVTTPEPSTSTPDVQVGECRDGWSEWISEDKPIIFRQNSDTERVPEKIKQSKAGKGVCARSQMVGIMCRSVGTHRPHTEQEGVRCTLEEDEGLVCQGRSDATGAEACWDYEVAFLCDCSITTVEISSTTTPLTPVTPPAVVTPSIPPEIKEIPMTCDEEGWSQWFNEHFPDVDGEFESLSEIRKTYSLCPDHYITDVECQPVRGGGVEPIVTCDKLGVRCRNNAGQQYCQDYEVRVLCQCECQDGLGMENYNITNEQITASSLNTPDDKPYGARLHSDWAWTAQPIDEFDKNAAKDEWLQVDLKEVKEVTGVVTQGHPYFEQFVETYAVQVSETGAVWEDVKEKGESFAKQFTGNNDRSTPVTNLFPEPVYARYVRIVPIDFYSAISLRVELKGCDTKEMTTPIGITSSTVSSSDTTTKPTCVNGWTSWMNTHTPSPQDWDDMDDLRSLAEKYTFCASHEILYTQCQVVGLGLSPEASGQVAITCNLNAGLQCIDSLQAPQHCFDYEVRFYCDCSQSTTTTEISPTTTEPSSTTVTSDACTVYMPQYKMHETDCRKFYQCSSTSLTGMTYVVKECGPSTFFNPETLTCDFEYNVIQVRQECIAATTTPPKYAVSDEPTTTTKEPCTGDYWTEWFNVSHPDTDRGDFETFDKIREKGFSVCEDMHIMNIECKYNHVEKSSDKKGGFKGGRKGSPKGGRRGQALDRLTQVFADYTNSDDMYVHCTTESGLICQNDDQPGRSNICEDYAIRVLCTCEAPATTPVRQPSTTPYIDVRESTILTTPHVIDDRCPPGQRYEPRAIRCDRVCLYYQHFLRQNGECLHDGQYAPACIDAFSSVGCPGNQYLRDKTTCVAIHDCNCRLPNGMPAPPGQAFLVADCEMCQCVNNFLRCDSSSCISTTPTSAQVTGKPIFECNKWSSWISESTPSSGNEMELLSDLRIKYPELCARPRKIECRVTESHESPEAAGQTVTCNRKLGLECFRSQNTEDCKNYEVRYLCECGELTDSDEGEFTRSTTEISTTSTYGDISITNATTELPMLNDKCPPAMTYEQCAMPCLRICMYHQSLLKQHGECLLDGDCAPGCVERTEMNTCPPGFFMFSEARCVAIADCNCRLSNGQALPAGVWYNVSKCEQCMCQNNNLLCSRSDDCEDLTTEPSYVTSRLPTIKYTPGLPTTTDPYSQIESLVRCNDWSPYYKKEKDSEGLILSLNMLRTRREFVCENPVNASCREVITKLPAADLGQIITCDAVEGLKCLNIQNTKNCHNYEISFFCECDETTPISTTVVTLGPTTSLVPCDAWSPWINDIKPWQSNGDTEFKTIEELREKFQFCLEGQLADIECVETATGLKTAADKGTTCDVRYGFRCSNEDQDRGSCLDYKIRYYCSCETTTVTTTIIPYFFTPPPRCDPDKFKNLLQEVDDSAFSSTTARNSVYGASRARLFDADGSLSTKSWAALISNHDQFIQVDLGSVVPVYGVEVAGNPLTRERVTAYTIQHSRDNNIWSVLPDDPKYPASSPKIFQGPWSPLAPLKQLFSEPIEARYLRLKPTEWHRAIALRFEVIGCDLPTVTPPSTTVREPECEEPMGLETGEMSELQITVSSVLNDQEYFYGKQNIPLNSRATPYTSAGAWLAEPKPDQFIRFDFMEPSKLSGVVTQGRDGADEWVESYTVRYSPDGQTWNTIKDPDGSDKIFPGNFDRNTQVENKFDRIVQARFLEIRPKTWKTNIALRAEVLGCFHPYPEVTTTPAPALTTTQPPPPYCSACPGLPEEYYDKCIPCNSGEYFDGQSCVSKLLCSCFEDGYRYNIGTLFVTKDCEECECITGGDTVCMKKECPPCEDGQQSVSTPSCGCVCKPCPPGSKLCPSSNYCLNESSWCNGLEECPDDELNCPTTTPEIPDVCPTPYCPDHWVTKVRATKGLCPTIVCEPPEVTTHLPCPLPFCPPYYNLVLVPNEFGGVCPEYECIPPVTTMEMPTCPPPSCQEGYVVQESDYIYELSQQTSDDGCTQYQCVTEVPPTAPCQPPVCMEGYDIFFADSKELLKLCPQYDCVPISVTTVCPPVECPSDLRIMYIQSSESSACPQYTCVQVTTPFPTTTSQPQVSTCAPMELPICGLNEEFYQTNPEETCPEFACRPIGSPEPTPGLPKVISPECNMEGRTFNSFDGSDYELEPCNHILAEDKINKDWIVSVHKNCSESEKCDRYLNITQEDKQLILRPDLLIIWDENTYTVTQAQRIGTSTNTFSISRVGDSIYFQSKTHSFSVEWNVEMNVNIILGDHLVNKVDGLCGFYTGDSNDDKTKPDGKLATSIKEYGQSWNLANEECEEKPKCTSEITVKAFELCNTIQARPFTECHSTVDATPFMKKCVDSVCECLNGGTDEECRCQALTRYITQCLEKYPEAPVSDWRIIAKCYEECGPGEIYQDCFRSKCEKSCDNKHDESLCPEVDGSCIPGCFCSPGLVRKGNRCVIPEQCRDCVCEGYGDPHYMTFDRHNYTFNGECSYIAARDTNARGQHKFQVITRNKRCTQEPVTVCTDAITILFNSHTVFISATDEDGVKVIIDEDEVTSFPHREPWLAVEQPDSSQIMAAIPDIHLEVTFFFENYGFSIRLPSNIYFNKTEGLCGNCNHNDEDDLVDRNTGFDESVDTFGRSWLLENEPLTCGVLEKDATLCIPLPPDQDPCLKIMDEDLFGKCHPVEDPAAYVSSCQLDACGSREPQVAACHSLEAYARRCAHLDICLDWRSEELCPKSCTGGQEYQSCAPGCVRTCDNYEELQNNPEACPISSVDGCFCLDGMVLDKGNCINASYCKTCDDEGHRINEVWQTDTCTTCECTSQGSICSTKTCPEDPICDEGYIVVEVNGTGDECCGPRKKCKVKPTEDCPPPVEPKDGCGYGQRQKLIEAPGVCPQYACVCLEQEDCPYLSTPDDNALKPGEKWIRDESGCCARYITQCTGVCPVVTCPEFHTLTEEPLNGEECCPKTKCDHPADACIYEHQYLIDIIGNQQPANTSDVPVKKLYKVNESWEDGLCLNCKCLQESEGHPRHQCTKQTCPTLDSHPDRGRYELESVETPGQCCPTVTRTACIDDYEVIKIGETFSDPLNACRSVECVKTTEGKVDKIEKIYSCDESCPAGWEYEPSPLYPQQCCGECVQVACVVEGEVKPVNATWVSEDLCTTYTCSTDKHDQIQIQAVDVQCSKPSEDDLKKYVFEESKVPGECCSLYTRVTCLLDGIHIPIGESVQDPQDNCATITCEAGADQNATRREKETNCVTKCDLGSTYAPPLPFSNDCCGKCVKTHCVDDGRSYSIGERWESHGDVCYEYSCEARNEVLTTIAAKKECPYFDPECPEEEIFMDELGCCKLCNITRQEKRDCKPKPMPAHETIGIFQISTRHVGTCKNPAPVPDFRQCSGHCDSFTMFQGQGRQANHISTCFCCKASRMEKIRVQLRCDSGVTFSPVYNNIVECECQKCNDGVPEYMGDDPSLDDIDFYSMTEDTLRQHFQN